MAATLPATASPLAQIEGWSSGALHPTLQKWPGWQRDALRRIIALNRTLTDTDFDDLEIICKAAHGIGAPLAPDPLTTMHLPSGLDAASDVSLVKLGKLKNVNRVKGEPPLEFGPSPGLTIIYGDNGAGKSGYARVIKKACRARGVPPTIVPDALSAKTTSPATAEITFMVGSVPTPVGWTDSGAGDPRLGNIFVFDSMSARAHIGEDGTTVFTPRGLDVLPQLAKACVELKARLKKQFDTIITTVTLARAGWKVSPATTVGLLLTKLNYTTKKTDVEGLATFTEDNRKRLTELENLLKSDPAIKAGQTQAAMNRIRAFTSILEARERALSETEVTRFKEMLEGLQIAEAAAKAAAGPAFDGSFLAGTGGDVWRRLWDIAKEYAAIASPDKAYPVVDEDAKCPLCQQGLDDDAKRRFQRFEEFVRNEARVRAAAEVEKLATLKADIAIMSKLQPEYRKVAADLADQSAPTKDMIDACVKSLDARLARLKDYLDHRRWGEFPALTASPVADLKTAVDTLDKRVAMERSAVDPAERVRLASERDELTDRSWLSGKKEEILNQIDKLIDAAALNDCEGDCTTNHLTVKNGELYDTAVTPTFCDRFKEECISLHLQTLPVSMESVGGSKGDRRFGVRLVGSHGPKVGEVASEGEQRCIALAAFLAELSLASHKSALVFDDPVSSLDHVHRNRVALRLCEESKVRQVIIFTHDAVFLTELLEASDAAGIEATCRNIYWNDGAPGYCEPGLPWDAQKCTERINALLKDQATIKRTWNPLPNPTNKAAMRGAYSRFRSTVEKVLQDVVFNAVIVRFRSYINISPRMLEPVVGFSGAECTELLRLHKRACDVTDAHDPATGKQPNVPNPDEFLADIDAMKNLIDMVKARRKTMTPLPTPAPQPTQANVVPVVITQAIPNIMTPVAVPLPSPTRNN